MSENQPRYLSPTNSHLKNYSGCSPLLGLQQDYSSSNELQPPCSIYCILHSSSIIQPLHSLNCTLSAPFPITCTLTWSILGCGWTSSPLQSLRWGTCRSVWYPYHTGGRGHCASVQRPRGTVGLGVQGKFLPGSRLL